MMLFSSLPTELTIRILTLSDPTELVHFREVNRFFKSLIDETTTFQYRIALFASGMVDGPPGNLSTSERLDLLRRHEACWRKVEWNEHNTILKPSGAVWELYGNVWGHGSGSNAIDFVQLPSRLRGIPMRQWTLRFDFSVRDFSMDPSQDLLVTIENFRNDPNLFRIHLRTLSTGQKHPLAGTTAFLEHRLSEIIFGRSSLSIRICGDYVGILFILGRKNDLIVWSWRTGVQKLVLSANLRSFAFLSDNSILASTLEPPALLVYSLEQPPADGTTLTNPHLIRFLFGTPFQAASDIILAMDPSPGWSQSARAGLQVPFQIAGDERLIAMHIQHYNQSGITSLIPTKTVLGYIERLPFKEGRDVDWELCGPILSERVPGGGIWTLWTCHVFGMRHIFPRSIPLYGKQMMIIRDFCPRRCLRASQEEREQSNSLYQVLMWGTRRPSHDVHSILKCVPLPENIKDTLGVHLMISEDSIVALEQDTATHYTLHLLTF
ncbi:hypothetical protein EI94DRAFT_1733136 [Lactarius quietus]|nr:hypothetical protein EI94DRAFT_1733136 [Lactarius quietus]